MLKFNAKVGEWGSGLRFKSRLCRILKKGHQPGVYVPLRALFLVLLYYFFKYKKYERLLLFLLRF